MSPTQSAPEPEIVKQPETIKDYIARGWTLHVQGDDSKSEADFRQALSMDSRSAEAAYGLGMALKGQVHTGEAIQAFEQAISLIKDHVMEDEPIRATMTRRMAEAQISMLQGAHPSQKQP